MRKDWFLFLNILLILAIGLTTLYSTVVGSESAFGGGLFNKQLLYVLVAIGVYFAVAYFDYRFLGNFVMIGAILGVVILLLAYVLFFGVEINNARRWFLFAGIQLQPSEFAKLALLITTSWILSFREKKNVWLLALFSVGVASILALLIFFEPDAGTTIVMLGIWGLTLFSVLPNQLFNAGLVATIMLVTVSVCAFMLGGTSIGIVTSALSAGIVGVQFLLSKKLKFAPFVAVLLGVGVGFGLMYAWNNVLVDYQKERIETYINPEGTSLDEGFQVEQSKVAIGSGMIWGKGFGLGTQSKLQFLPEHQTDFIFATYAEEFGLVGSLVLLALYASLIFRIFRTASTVENSFGNMICIAVGTKLLVEIFINIGMNIGIVPATGVPLPLMSAGGSMLLVTMIALGLVQSARLHRDD